MLRQRWLMVICAILALGHDTARLSADDAAKSVASDGRVSHRRRYLQPQAIASDAPTAPAKAEPQFRVTARPHEPVATETRLVLVPGSAKSGVISRPEQSATTSPPVKERRIKTFSLAPTAPLITPGESATVTYDQQPIESTARFRLVERPTPTFDGAQATQTK